jgi:hypothetical protein
LRRKIGIFVTVLVFAIITTATACSRDDDSHLSLTHITQDGAESDTPLVMVPDLIGQSFEALKNEFEDLGFMLSLFIIVSDEPAGTVLFIDQMGRHVPTPASIDVFISGGSPDWVHEAPDDSGQSMQQPDREPDTPANPNPPAWQPDTGTETTDDNVSPKRLDEFERKRFGGIDWLVLEEKDGKVLLLSEFVLFDDQPYNAEFTTTTWEHSSIRSYLNNEFFNDFNPRDRERIAKTIVINDDRMASFFSGDEAYPGVHSWLVPAGNDTEDRVFLLSLDEVRKYFSTHSDREVKRSANDENNPGWSWAWWLRTPGYDNFNAVCIMLSASVNSEPVSKFWGVRPAMWIYAY